MVIKILMGRVDKTNDPSLRNYELFDKMVYRGKIWEYRFGIVMQDKLAMECVNLGARDNTICRSVANDFKKYLKQQDYLTLPLEIENGAYYSIELDQIVRCEKMTNRAESIFLQTIRSNK